MIPNPQLSLKTTYNNGSSMSFTAAVISPTSSSIYTAAKGANTGDLLLTKTLATQATAWTKLYNPLETTSRGIVLSGDESRLFILRVSASLVEIDRVRTSDGVMDSLFRR